VVLTGGFAEVGPEGRARQDELLAVCRAAGMRMVGPNSSAWRVRGPRSPSTRRSLPPRRRPATVGFASQSGGFGSAAIDAAAARGIGFASFVTMGDKADLSGSDFLEYWEQDPDTAVLLLYLDSFGNPRRFGRIARRITTAKPIVAVKSARTAGRRAASSRTGALLAAADVTVDALFAHAGVLRAETVGGDVRCRGAARAPAAPARRPRRGAHQRRGPGVACEDACEAAGLRVQPLSDATRKQLAEGLGADVSTANPVDMTASATADQYERSLRVLLADDEVDAVVTVFVRPLAARAAEVARGIAAAAQGADRPVLAVWLGADAPAAADAGAVPRFTTPEEAVRALAHAVRHARRGRRRPTRRTSRPTPTPRRPRPSSPRAWGAGEAGWRPGTSSACCAAGASRWWRAGWPPRRRPRAGPPQSWAGRSRSRRWRRVSSTRATREPCGSVSPGRRR
jgi:acyl-CoA synthetase (NDP forming)